MFHFVIQGTTPKDDFQLMSLNTTLVEQFLIILYIR